MPPPDRRFGEIFQADGRPVVLRLWPHDLRDKPSAVALSPDGATVAIANVPSVWALAPGSEKAWRRAVLLLDRDTLERPRLLVDDFGFRALAFDARGERLAAVGGDWDLGKDGESFIKQEPPFLNRIAVWRVSDGVRLFDLPFPHDRLERLAFADDGSLYVEGAAHGLRAYQLPELEPREAKAVDATIRRRLALSREDVAPRAASPDATAFAVKDADTSGLAIVVRGADGERRREVAPAWNIAHRLELAPGGATLFAAGSASSTWWDLETGRLVAVVRDRFLGFDAHGSLRVRRVENGAETVVHLRDGREERRLPKLHVTQLARDGIHALVQSGADVEWRDLESGECLRRYEGEPRANREALALSPLGNAAVVHPGAYTTIAAELWDLAPDRRARLDLGNAVYTEGKYAFDDAGASLVAGGLVHRFDEVAATIHVGCFEVPGAARRWLVKLPPVAQGPVNLGAVAIDPRGEWVAVAWEQGQRAEIVLLALADGAEVRRISGFLKAGGLAFSSDGSRLFVAYDAYAISEVQVRGSA